MVKIKAIGTAAMMLGLTLFLGACDKKENEVPPPSPGAVSPPAPPAETTPPPSGEMEKGEKSMPEKSPDDMKKTPAS